MEIQLDSYKDDYHIFQHRSLQVFNKLIPKYILITSRLLFQKLEVFQIISYPKTLNIRLMDI